MKLSAISRGLIYLITATGYEKIEFAVRVGNDF